MSSLLPSPLQKALESIGDSYAVIGAHAVNVWLEPRFTADIDLAVRISPDGIAQLKRIFAESGLEVSKEYGEEQASGPDFIRFTNTEADLVVEIQVAKTSFQSALIKRASKFDGVRVSTAEDLVVMKLIADRPKDRIDLLGLVELPDLDWNYIESWVKEWDVADRLARVREQ